MKQGNFQISRDGSRVTISIEFPIDALSVQSSFSPLHEQPKEDRLIFIKNAPEIALVSVSTLRRMKASGEISYVRVRSRIFFRESVLIGIREERRLNGKSI